MSTWEQLLATNCKFDAYIEKDGRDHYLYLLVGNVKVYWTKREQVEKQWYDFPEDTHEHRCRTGGWQMAEVKKTRLNPSVLLKDYLEEAFDLPIIYDIDYAFANCKENLYLAPIIRDCLELHLFDVYFDRIVEKREELVKYSGTFQGGLVKNEF